MLVFENLLISLVKKMVIDGVNKWELPKENVILLYSILYYFYFYCVDISLSFIICLIAKPTFESF